MNNIKAVLFDLDNTLIQRMRAIPKVAAAICKYYFKDRPEDHEFISDTFCDCFSDGYIKNEECYKLFVDIVGWETPLPYEHFFRFWCFYYPINSTPVDDMTDSVMYLKNKGYKLGIITNGPIGMQNAKMDTLGEDFRAMFDIIIVSADFGVHKPDPSIFSFACAELGFETNECVYVGDHPRNDVEGARGSGMHTIWYEGFMPWDEQYEPAKYVISGLRDLMEIL
ncbi:MAG: HAD family hydrolase [Clostridiales bacterium]|nr:HAD family hydrolase [Clostridiales bacterium]